MVCDCSICLNEHNQQLAEPIIYHEIYEIPGIKTGTDIFELFKNAVIIADYTS